MSCKFDFKSRFSQMIIVRVFVPFCFLSSYCMYHDDCLQILEDIVAFIEGKKACYILFFITAVFLVYDFNDIKKMSCKIFNYLN